MKDEFSKRKKTLYKSSEKTYVTDPDTGEILTTEETIKNLIKQEDVPHLTFTKMFYRDMGRLYGLSKSAIVLFLDLASMMKDDKNQVIITPIERDLISKRTGLSKQTIYNSTRELVEVGLIVRVVTSVYMIDPNLFAVGSDPAVLANRNAFERIKTINMLVQYSESGRSVSVFTE
jgi:hypothetical protein